MIKHVVKQRDNVEISDLSGSTGMYDQSSSHYSTTIMARTKGGVLKHSPHSRADMAKCAARKQCAKIVVARRKIPRKKATILKLPRHTTSLAPKPVSIAHHRDSRATTWRKSMPPEHTVSTSPRTKEDDLLSVDNLHDILGKIILLLGR